jgi:MIP family channel proteins
MPTLVQRLAAEAVGTFAFVLIGAGVVVTTAFPGAGFGLLGIALAHALALSVMVTATLRISGGHLNPAVTAGLLAGRRIAPRDAALYVAAQLAGAVAAGFLVKALLPGGAASVVGYGVPVINGQITLGKAIAIEAVLTFLLVTAVYGTAVAKNAPAVGGFGIGLTLFFTILVGGPLTGAALNPARAFGPAVVANAWTGHAAWWIGPILGGLVAGLLWDRVLLKGEREA